MSRTLLLAAAAIAGSIAFSAQLGPAFAQASTIRIEPRAAYGATVNLEHGVRVWRSLPSTKYVIINPGHRTPLNLSLADVNERHTSTSHNYNYDNTSYSPEGDYGYLANGYGYGGRFLGGSAFGSNRFNNRNQRQNLGARVSRRGGGIPARGGGRSSR